MIVRKLGVISDTHGLIREEVFDYFKDCDLILHAGDIVKEESMRKLESICPVIAVRGNNDYALGDEYKEVREIVINESIKVIIIHDITQLRKNIEDYDLVIHGHTHRFSKEYKGKTLILNSGSFGPLRFSLPISLAVIDIDMDNKMNVKFYEI